MRYFIWFSYDGTNYHGWQLQPNGNTVQAELQRALSLLLREEITVTGAGRTDTGVHARQMAAHFDTDILFVALILIGGGFSLARKLSLRPSSNRRTLFV